MAFGGIARDASLLVCKACGRSGVARYEQRAHLPSRRLPNGYAYHKLISIEGEFKPGAGNDPPIYCACGAKVVA